MWGLHVVSSVTTGMDLGVSFGLVVIFWYLSFVTRDKPSRASAGGVVSAPALQHSLGRGRGWGSPCGGLTQHQGLDVAAVPGWFTGLGQGLMELRQRGILSTPRSSAEPPPKPTWETGASMISYFLYGQKRLSVGARAALFAEALYSFKKKNQEGSEELRRGLVEQRHGLAEASAPLVLIAPAAATLGPGTLTLHVAERGAFGAPGLPLGNRPRAPVGEGLAGGVRLCSSAPSGAGAGAGPRVSHEQHCMASHCVLCCKRPSHGWHCRGREVTKEDAREVVAGGRAVGEQQGAQPGVLAPHRGTVSPAVASPRAGWGFTKSSPSQRLPAISGEQAGALPSSWKGGSRPGCPRRHPAPCSILAARFKACLGWRKLSQEEEGAASIEDLGCSSHLTGKPSLYRVLGLGVQAQLCGCSWPGRLAGGLGEALPARWLAEGI